MSDFNVKELVCNLCQYTAICPLSILNGEIKLRMSMAVDAVEGMNT